MAQSRWTQIRGVIRRRLTHHHRILREGFWSVAGQAITAIGALVGVRLVTQFVTRDIYGTVSLALGLTVLAQKLLCAPILEATKVLYFEYQRGGELPVLRQVVNKLLLVTTLPICAGTLVVGGFYAHWSGLSFWLFVFLAGYVAVDVPRSMEYALLAMARRQKAYSFILSVDALFRPVIIVLAVVAFGPTSQSVMLAYLAVAGVTLVVLTRMMTREGIEPMNVEPAKRKALIGAIRKFGLPLVPLAFVSWLTGQSDRYIVGGMVSVAAAGSYAAAYGLISQPFIMTQGIVMRILQPHLIHAVDEGNRARERQIMLVWVLIVGSACVAGFGAICLLKHWIVYLLLAKEFRADALPLIPWIGAGYIFYAIATSMENLLYARRQTHLVVIAESTVGALAFLVPLVLVHYKKLVGAAMACPVYFGVSAIVMFIFVTRFAPAAQSPNTSKSE